MQPTPGHDEAFWNFLSYLSQEERNSLRKLFGGLPGE
jgi:hypothetical protein